VLLTRQRGRRSLSGSVSVFRHRRSRAVDVERELDRVQGAVAQHKALALEPVALT
jgi:hypothetical protein